MAEQYTETGGKYMLNEVPNRIAENYGRMTKAEKKIAAYLMEEKEDLCLTSITEFASSCGVADSTVFRFCKLLGYSGYNDFKLALAKAQGSAKSKRDQEAEEDVYSSITVQDSIATTGNKLRIMYRAAIDQTLDLLDPEQVARAADILHQSERVYCMGQGGSMIMAQEAWVRFMVVSRRFSTVENIHLQLITASLLTERDTIWFFTYSGAMKDMVDILEAAKERGAKVIVVTRFANSPAIQYADVVLICGSNERPMHSGTIVAKIAQMTVIDMVYQEYIRRDFETVEKNRELTCQAISKRAL